MYYITTKENNSKNYNIIFMDYDYSSNSPVTEASVKTLSKNGLIDKEYSDDKVHKEFIRMITEMNIHEISTGYLNETTLNNASSYIAASGRIGLATHLIISQNTYKEYESTILNFKNKYNMVLVFDNSIRKDIYLYRKNTEEQPGILLLKHEDNYKLETIGLQPEKQFIKIVT